MPRPEYTEFGSALAAMACMALGFAIALAGQRLWDRSRRILGGLRISSGCLLGLYGPFGILLHVDAWALWRYGL